MLSRRLLGCCKVHTSCEVVSLCNLALLLISFTQVPLPSSLVLEKYNFFLHIHSTAGKAVHIVFFLHSKRFSFEATDFSWIMRSAWVWILLKKKKLWGNNKASTLSSFSAAPSFEVVFGGTDENLSWQERVRHAREETTVLSWQPVGSEQEGWWCDYTLMWVWFLVSKQERFHFSIISLCSVAFGLNKWMAISLKIL